MGRFRGPGRDAMRCRGKLRRGINTEMSAFQERRRQKRKPTVEQAQSNLEAGRA
ncbi:MAG: hypothetical protein CM15mP25_5290 [Gammaproteobacteria bacterium]|nr:MAG: hypothetical protein CM15mP25_5290 [Gammaproteobacteria bacterium]